MPKLVKYTKADHRLSRIPSKRQYQTWMQKRINWNKIPKYTILDWKKDASEYAQRIWKCWELSKYRYTYHGVAIFLIVPVQLLNCSVEIVFSKLEKTQSHGWKFERRYVWNMLAFASEYRLVLYAKCTCTKLCWSVNFNCLDWY